MAAVVTVRAFTGVAAGTMSGVVTGIDLLSVDNAVNTPANRLANPVKIGYYSYEKWIKLRVDVAPVTNITSILVWGDGVVQPNTRLFYGFTTVGATSINTRSNIATIDWATATVGNKASWDTGNYPGVGVIGTFLVLQLYVEYLGLLIGDWTQEVIEYSFDET